MRSDIVMTAAYSHELSNYGATVYNKGGQKNYAAAYATGLLVARRVLKKLGMDHQYLGVSVPDGKDYHVVKPTDVNRRPFLVLLDIGLHYTTTGARVFAAMKGAVDGGLSIPHSNRRFPGYSVEKKKFDSRVLRKYIFGGHVAEYMRKLQEGDPEKYKTHFSRYIAAGIGPNDVEKMWATVHSNIRKNPAHVKSPPRDAAPKKVRQHKTKRSLAQRKEAIRRKIAAAETIKA
eukprot:TRINITY_DN393_c0_g1_i13.p1 TRINITY_DN393_c0_g1~~TRINITY_DN393_c0_g1_i13.p1  ORF type:complete len:232 (+),score=37.52 TRINITY_DN393_c0_g1_i13:334-1029(+)